MADVILFGVSHPHARAHLKTLALLDRVDTIGLQDDDAKMLADVASDTGLSETFDTVEAAIADGRPAWAVACYPNDTNADLCVRLLEAGIHVISEKPIGATAEDVARVVAAGRANDRRVGVMYQNRFHPLSLEARRIVQSGAIGRITACEARLITSQVRFRNPGHWLFKKDVAGGGILSWLGCHYLDLLRFVTGADITRVSAMVDTLSGEAIDVEDVASVSLKFDAGFLGSLQAGYQLSLSRSGYMGPTYETYMSIRGTEGRVLWEPSSGEIRLTAESTQWREAPSREFTFSLPEVDAYGGAYGLAFVEQFVDATRGAAETPADGTDALQVARVIEAAYRSSDEGRHVDVSGAGQA